MHQNPDLAQLKSLRNESLAQKRVAECSRQAAWEAMTRALDRKERAQAARDSYSHAKQHEALRLATASIESVEYRITQLSRSAYMAWRHCDHKLARAYSKEVAWLKQIRSQQKKHYSTASQKLARVTASDRYQQLLEEYEQQHQEFLHAAKAFRHARDAYRSAQAAYSLAERNYQLARGIDPLWHRNYTHRELATLAEVDTVYIIGARHANNLKIRTTPSGEVNIYYGGIGTPDGEGHGHHTLSPQEKLHYKREPFEPRGPHNFIR